MENNTSNRGDFILEEKDYPSLVLSVQGFKFYQMPVLQCVKCNQVMPIKITQIGSYTNKIVVTKHCDCPKDE